MHNDLFAARGLFETPAFPLLYPAVLAGNQPATVWHDGNSGFLWDLSYKRYVAGGYSDEVATLLRASVEEWLSSGSRPMAVVVPMADVWIDALPEALPGFRLTHETMNVYRFSGREVDREPPEGRYAVTPISRPVIEESQAVREEVAHMWGSVELFLERGFGWAMLKAEGWDDQYPSEVVSWCTAEYLSKHKVGLGVETLRAHQGKGLATTVAMLCATEGHRRGLDVYWECNTLNPASMRVAEKAGFEQVGAYPIVVVEKGSSSS